MWDYTPRQIMAYCFLAQRRTDADSFRFVSNYLLANGTQEQLDKQMGQWMKELE